MRRSKNPSAIALCGLQRRAGDEASGTVCAGAPRRLSGNQIRQSVTDFAAYDLTETVDEIREWYYFNETCQKTVPQAITCALEADGFEDVIRNAISIGGIAIPLQQLPAV